MPRKLVIFLLPALLIASVILHFSQSPVIFDEGGTDEKASKFSIDDLRLFSVGEDGTTLQPLASECPELSWEYREKVEEILHEKSALVVRVLANVACGQLEARFPSAKVENNTVSLGWKWVQPKGGVSAACLCTRRLELRIPQAATIMDPVISFDNVEGR